MSSDNTPQGTAYGRPERLLKDRARDAIWIGLILVAGIVLVYFVASQGGEQASLFGGPIAAAFVGALIIYLTLDRVREMNARLAHIEDRSAELWQSVGKEIREVATSEAKTTISQMQATLRHDIEQLSSVVNQTLTDNPWLTSDPAEVIMATKHLEPIIATVRTLLAGGNKHGALAVVIQALNDPEVKGTPNDFHNLGVLAARDLDDDLLAATIYDRYLGSVDAPDADVLADALQVHTRSRTTQKADAIAERLTTALHEGDRAFANRWRPWVFLADYQKERGEPETALATLNEGLDAVKDPGERAHVLTNIAEHQEALGRTADAERTLRECLDSFPVHAPAAIRLAFLMWRAGRSSEAESTLISVMAKGQLDPTFDRSFMLAHAVNAKLQIARGAWQEARLSSALAQAQSKEGLAQLAAAVDALESFQGP